MRSVLRPPHCAPLSALVLALFAAQGPLAQAAEPAKPAAKPATSHQQLKSQAKGLALATETVEQINQAQLDVAARVLTGDADCEFNQKVQVSAIEGQPGHFQVGYKKAVYRMVPQETTTGAVRLEDRKAGVMWLQIPSKSMLMNSKIGQRMVDACTHSEQRAAVAAAEAAGKAMAVSAQAASAQAAAQATAPADAASGAKAE
ncbi:MAG: hypothetical protein HY855_22395 [Burkholderiales bacterium]|nr:hypothetical protein [Burkholderiales bacterium]